MHFFFPCDKFPHMNFPSDTTGPCPTNNSIDQTGHFSFLPAQCTPRNTFCRCPMGSLAANSQRMLAQTHIQEVNVEGKHEKG